MEVAALGPDGLGDLADERDHVVVGRLLDLGDPLDVDRGARLDRRERVGGDEAARGLGAGDRELDAEHLLEAGLLGPDRAHLGQRVAADHRAAPAALRTAPTARRPTADVVAALHARPADRVRGAFGAPRAPPRGPRPARRPSGRARRAVSPAVRRRSGGVAAWKTSAPARRPPRRARRSRRRGCGASG